MFSYAFTIFLSAFLLFQVQPLIGKYILPWFGGASFVWTTCLLFFQVMLLLGYAYADFIGKQRGKSGARLHSGLLTVSLFALPITPQQEWLHDSAQAFPAQSILLLLALSIGLPYLVLSSTGPLLQKWFSVSYPGRSPYRLYALSNVGSLLALISYPFIIEPILSRQFQVWVWSGLYLIFVGGCASCAWWVSRCEPVSEEPLDLKEPSSTKVESGRVLLWLALTASASAMLLATTNQLTQDVASVPFLWILPLAIYLLSFIICFDNERWYDRRVFGALLMLALPGAVYALYRDVDLDIVLQIALYSVALFACCMVCHGELVRSKPDPERLTFFYLIVATGGALGGIFVAVLAPILFDGFWEFHFALAACSFFTLLSWFLAAERSGDLKKWSRPLVLGILSIAWLGFVWALHQHRLNFRESIIAQSRNFYGVLRVSEIGKGKRSWRRNLLHGNIRHGTQYHHKNFRNKPISYYGEGSGIWLAMQHYPREERKNLKVGVLGLGIGTMVAFGQPGDQIQFFEINPKVEEFAYDYFTYLRDAQADISVTLGDGRIKMEQELREGAKGSYDAIVMDAFSGDAVPMHLLTEEAAEVYWQLLREDGLLMINITNRFLDLKPVVFGLAEATQTKIAIVKSKQNKRNRLIDYAVWAVLAKEGNSFLSDPRVVERASYLGAPRGDVIHWTDDFASLLSILK